MQLPDGTALLAGLAAFGITYLLMPSVARLGRRKDWVDSPDEERRAHSAIVPRSGGIAIWFGVIGGLLVALFIGSTMPGGLVENLLGMAPATGLAILGGMSVAALAGFLDDMRPLGARVKLAAQTGAALPLLLSTELVGTVQVLLGGSPFAEWAAYPLIVAWVVFLMNAINLVDGLDGLAGGLVVIAATFIVLIGGLGGGGLLLALAVVGALLGFLRFNMPPARVFMGDTGSLMIGYALAVLAVLGLDAEPTGRRAMAMLVILGVPGLDTLMTVVRRSALRIPIFRPDGDHLHHRMLERAGGVHARAVTTFFLIQMTLGVFAMLVAWAAPELSTWVFSIVVLLAMVLLWDLRYFDITSYSRSGKQPIPRARELKPRPKGASDAPPSRTARMPTRVRQRSTS